MGTRKFGVLSFAIDAGIIGFLCMLAMHLIAQSIPCLPLAVVCRGVGGFQLSPGCSQIIHLYGRAHQECSLACWSERNCPHGPPSTISLPPSLWRWDRDTSMKRMEDSCVSGRTKWTLSPRHAPWR